MFNNGVSGIIPTMNLNGQNNGNNGMMDGGWGAWIIIILFALIFGRNGWGDNNGNNGGNGGSCCAPATCADLQRGFDNQTTQMRFNGIDQGLCSLGYDNAVLVNGVNTNLMQQGFETRNAITQMGIDQMQNTNALSRQLADCCCENRAAIAQVRYDMATDTCAIQNTIQNSTRDIIDNDNANWRALNDKLTQMEMDRLRTQLTEKDAVITAQNNRISNDAQSKYLIDTLRPCPIPSYPTCNPWANQAPYGSCCGSNYNGCGC